MKKQKFCRYQIYAEWNEDILLPSISPFDKSILACIAELDPSKIFECPYKPEDIFEKNNTLKIARKNDKGTIESICSDFKIIQRLNNLF